MTEGDEWSKAWQGDTTEEYRGPAGWGPDLPLKARPTGRGRVKRKIRVRRLAVQVRGRA